MQLAALLFASSATGLYTFHGNKLHPGDAATTAAMLFAAGLLATWTQVQP
jgi:hypothetical protein